MEVLYRYILHIVVKNVFVLCWQEEILSADYGTNGTPQYDYPSYFNLGDDFAPCDSNSLVTFGKIFLPTLYSMVFIVGFVGMYICVSAFEKLFFLFWENIFLLNEFCFVSIVSIRVLTNDIKQACVLGTCDNFAWLLIFRLFCFHTALTIWTYRLCKLTRMLMDFPVRSSQLNVRRLTFYLLPSSMLSVDFFSCTLYMSQLHHILHCALLVPSNGLTK